MKTQKLFTGILFGIKSSIVIALVGAFALYSCEKESNSDAGIPSKEKGLLLALKNPTLTLNDATSSPFSIFYASVNSGNLFLGLKYQATSEQSKFSVVWDGNFEQKDDSTFINLTVLREAAGTLQAERSDSLSTSLTQIGITQENLCKAKTVVKVKNGYSPNTVISIKLENGIGAWPINPIVSDPGTGTDPGTGGTNPPADSTGTKR